MRKRLAIVVAIVPLVTAAFFIAPSLPVKAAFPGANGVIAWQRISGDVSQIWVMASDGSNPHQLTADGSNADPSWSPSGTRIVFDSTRDGNSELYVMNADGTGQTRLTYTPADESTPAWSPDGTKIVYSSGGDLYVMDANGAGSIAITSGPAKDVQPSWQPGGSTIAFQRVTGSDKEIFTVNSVGSGLTNLSAESSGKTDRGPDWSPDGSQLVFWRTGLWVMNADGSDATAIPDGLPGYGPAWSPDGEQIAFSSDRSGGSSEIYAVPSDGGTIAQLTSNGDENLSPTWQPIPYVGAVAGGGRIVGADSATMIAFGGNVRSNADGTFVGNWWTEFSNVSGTGFTHGTFVSSAISILNFGRGCGPGAAPPPAPFSYAGWTAQGRFNDAGGWLLFVRATDRGEPGKGMDSIRISLTNPAGVTVYDTWGSNDFIGNDLCQNPPKRHALDAGNVQILFVRR